MKLQAMEQKRSPATAMPMLFAIICSLSGAREEGRARVEGSVHFLSLSLSSLVHLLYPNLSLLY